MWRSCRHHLRNLHLPTRYSPYAVVNTVCVVRSIERSFTKQVARHVGNHENYVQDGRWLFGIIQGYITHSGWCGTLCESSLMGLFAAILNLEGWLELHDLRVRTKILYS